jgi:hypothetical protein
VRSSSETCNYDGDSKQHHQPSHLIVRNAATSGTSAGQISFHYEFPLSREAAKDHEWQERGDRNDEITSFPASVSARRDLVTQYWATKTGKAQITMTSTLIGVALGKFLGKIRGSEIGKMFFMQKSCSTHILSTNFIICITHSVIGSQEACTWRNPRGDLARSCGMRVVSAVGELWEIQTNLAIITKATVVSSQIIDQAMVLDRKHRVKDRLLIIGQQRI